MDAKQKKSGSQMQQNMKGMNQHPQLKNVLKDKKQATQPIQLNTNQLKVKQ